MPCLDGWLHLPVFHARLAVYYTAWDKHSYYSSFDESHSNHYGFFCKDTGHFHSFRKFKLQPRLDIATLECDPNQRPQQGKNRLAQSIPGGILTCASAVGVYYARLPS